MYPPSPLINVGKYRVFSNKKGKNYLIINIESGGRENPGGGGVLDPCLGVGVPLRV